MPCRPLVVGIATAPALEPWQRACLERLERVATLRTSPDAACDVVLRLARDWPPPPGPTPPYGVWAFAFGTPPSPWPVGWAEIAEGRHTVGAQLVRLDPARPGEAFVLRSGLMQTRDGSPAAVAARVLMTCAAWPALVCADLATRGEAALEGPRIGLAGPPHRPGLLQQPRFLAGCARRRWRKLRQVAGQDDWSIGIVAKPAHAFLADPRPEPVRWLPELLADGYHADPFPFREGGRTLILAEGYGYGDRQGYLALLDPDAATETRLSVPLPGHLSYPYPIARDGALYCIPESHQARRVVLLRAAPSPERWMVERVLLDDLAGVDATPVEHGGRWWLFAADHDDQDQTKLFLYMAEALEGPWRPHPQNPVKVDCRSSRPGGRPFVHEGVLYRPAQDCSRTYGGAIVLNRVLELTPERFREEEAVRIEPVPGWPCPDGLHHFVPFGEVTVIDAKRERFDAVTLARWLGWRLRTPSAR